jgi:benzodiazapine receptor
MSTVSARPLRDLSALVAWLVLCFAVAGLGGYWTAQGVGAWYGGLRKPGWTPPSWIFGPAWSALYASMAVAAWLAWRRRNQAGAWSGLVVFGVQFALNLAWSGIFFALRQPGLAFGEVLLLWAASVAMILALARVDRWAAGLLVPYLAWVTFASALNFANWRLNPDSEPSRRPGQASVEILTVSGEGCL